MKDLESKEITEADLELLRLWCLTPADFGARRIILVGRLQRELRVIVDGKWGPRTSATLEKRELQLGPELSHVVERAKTQAQIKQRVNR